MIKVIIKQTSLETLLSGYISGSKPRVKKNVFTFYVLGFYGQTLIIYKVK